MFFKGDANRMKAKVLDQTAFEEALNANLEHRRSLKSSINGKMHLHLTSCDFKDRSAIFQYKVPRWSSNLNGNMHGGIIAALFDIALSTVILSYHENDKIPTVQLQVNFVRPIKIGATLHVHVKLTGLGKRVVHATAEAYIKDMDDPAATASGVFYALKPQA